MMNLILSVIVDKAAHAREGDKEERLKTKKETEAESLRAWGKVLEQIDTDHDHKISMDEIMHGYDVPMVRDNMNMLGISKGDLDEIFTLMDLENSGDLDYKQFLGMFHKAQGQDLRIYLMMMHLQNQRMGHTVDLLRKDIATTNKAVAQLAAAQLTQVGDATGPRTPEPPAVDPTKVTM